MRACVRACVCVCVCVRVYVCHLQVPANTSPRPQLKEGKRKASQSLNHLLNFTIASSSGSPGWGGNLPLRSHKHRPMHHFSKEQFLQAKYVGLRTLSGGRATLHHCGGGGICAGDFIGHYFF